MEAADTLYVILRWFHVLGGIVWIGFLMFFAFILGPSLLAVASDHQRVLYPAILGRVASWVRSSVGITYVTGLLLLGTVFHAGGLMFESGWGWGPLAGILALMPILLFMPYEFLAKSSAGQNLSVMGAVALSVTAAYLYGMTDFAGMTYRASLIHVGFFYGTIMAANVFMRILPAQRRIIAAMNSESAPSPDDLVLVQLRAKHNIYLVAPLVWSMLNMHTTVFAGWGHLTFILVLIVSWAITYLLFRSSARRQS